MHGRGDAATDLPLLLDFRGTLLRGFVGILRGFVGLLEGSKAAVTMIMRNRRSRAPRNAHSMQHTA